MSKILLVEDDQIDQLAFKRIFQKHFPNDTCIIAESIKAAFENYETSSFDFLVLDYNLSDGNAFEFLSPQIKTPVVILSGAINAQLIQKAKEKGALDFLLKDSRLQYLPLIMDLIHQHLYASPSPLKQTTSPTPSDNQTFDLQFLNQTFDKNKTQIKEILEVFLERNPIDLDHLIHGLKKQDSKTCLLYTSPSPRDGTLSRMPSSA